MAEPTPSEAARARDAAEAQARLVYAAALAWVVAHGEDEEPDRDTPVARAALTLSLSLLRAARRQFAGSPKLPTGAARTAWVEDTTRQITNRAVAEAREHYSTVTKRLKREDPDVSDRLVKATFRTDSAWSEAAARTAATRRSAETAMDMVEHIETVTGEPHSKLWVSRGDPKVRSSHRKIHGRVRSLGDSFHHEHTLRYPGDPKAPLDETINCRCALFLVPTKDKAEAEKVFFVPNEAFDVPVAASAWTPDRRRAERELRSELARNYYR